MESESKHFSHEHELTLNKVQQLDDGETERAVCYACLEPIAEQAFFSCGDCDDFFLHQTCANLSNEMEGPVHPQHPLILLATRSCNCDVCGRRHWKRFTYNCALCDFDVCVACALEGKIKHHGHDHPLIPYNQVKENDTGGEEVVCGGCNKPITDDDAYSCSDCNFFLHKTCAELPEVINNVSHPIHSLELFKKPPYLDSLIRCDCCHETWRWFTYNCKLCDHNICVSCSFVTKSSALESINHISHQHRLIVEAHSADYKKVKCYGCEIPITGLAFTCSVCNFFLHKTCVDLPYQVEYFSHPKHLLTLLFQQDQTNGQLLCACCGGTWVRFIYYCELCEFKICLPCALLSVDRPPSIQKKFLHDHTLYLFSRPPDSYSSYSCSCCGERPELLLYRCELCDFNLCMSCASCDSLITTHRSHDHPLTVMRRALFRCDACGVEDKDLSYTCTTCKFCVHKNCASLESTFQSGHHTQHALTLAFSLPQQFLKYMPTCEICAKRMRADLWLYFCAACRFFAHIQCATSELKSISEQSEFKVGETFKVMKFPVPDEFMNQISYFLQVLNIGGIQRATELSHVSHPYSLILCDVQAGNICISKDDLLVCNGCAQLIVTPNSYYRCGQISCDFFLHTLCTELPDEVQHPCHPEHPLSFHPKSSAESLSIYVCKLCRTRCNGFRYCCEVCNFDLDLRCASVPDTIEHEAHRHPLVPATGGVHCSACRKYCSYVTYGCDTCGFYLEVFCAMLPRTATHYYDAHPLSLVYPPFPDHPDEFYCEMCQDEIAPNLWLYHCRDCNQSFHPRCLLPGQFCSNIKSGGTCVVAKNIHEHPKLKLQKILQGERTSKWRCSLCGEGKSATLTCTKCDFLMCLRCLSEYPAADVQWISKIS